jgi:dihydrodipicolinate synthase/N-acetylneuraminate lyase
VKEIKSVSGVIVPMVTPFSSPSGKIDDRSVARIVEHLIAHDVSIFLLGTTGEARSVSKAGRWRLVASVARAVGRRTAVYAGISSDCLADSLKDAACWADLGVTAAVAHVPGFYPLEGDEILRYYESLADALPLPLILYNIPATTHHSLPIGIVDQLSQHPNIVGLKDSERDPERLKKCISLWGERSDFSVLVGWAAHSADAIQWGADGIVPSTGNILPGLYKRLWEAALSRDAQTAEELQAQTNRISDLYQRNRSLGGSLAALKALMSELGLCRPHVLPPLLPLKAEDLRFLREAVQRLDLPTYHSRAKEARQAAPAASRT